MVDLLDLNLAVLKMIPKVTSDVWFKKAETAKKDQRNYQEKLEQAEPQTSSCR